MKPWLLVIGVLVVWVLLVKLRPSAAGAASAKDKVKGGALVVDVRTAAEYKGGHVDGALNIPVQELESRLGELKDKQRAIVVYCASGIRSARAAAILRKAGFADVTNAGGYGSLK
ncbi:MAG: rhodanese-like domain-containing protein [bacterium]